MLGPILACHLPVAGSSYYRVVSRLSGWGRRREVPPKQNRGPTRAVVFSLAVVNKMKEIPRRKIASCARRKQHKKNQSIVCDCYARLPKSKVSPQETKTKRKSSARPLWFVAGWGERWCTSFYGPGQAQSVEIMGYAASARQEVGSR